MIEDYDLLVIGSGEGGKILSWNLAAQGKRVAVVERKYIGGSCPNIACLPSKNVIHSAKIASYLREFGGQISMATVRDRKQKMIDGLIKMHLQKYDNSGSELVMGTARFVAERIVEVQLNAGGQRTLKAENIVINTGSRARIDDIPGLRNANPMTHIEALELDYVPRHLVVLGGGYIGLEFAQAMARFGSRVTIIERNATLIHREDSDVVAAVTELFNDEGIEILTATTVHKVEGRSGDSVRLQTSAGEIEATDLLVAGGRIPNTDNLGLESIGVEVDERGHIRVDDRRRTTAAGVWAVGDCAGGPYFTHISFDDFRVVLDNLSGGNRTTTGRQVPFCLFIDPEFARVGLSEREAKEQGIRYRLAKIPMAQVLRTRTLAETRGFMKALIEANGNRILGFTAFGVEVGELIATVQVAMIAGLSYEVLRDMVLTHPTMAEGLSGLFASALVAAS